MELMANDRFSSKKVLELVFLLWNCIWFLFDGRIFTFQSSSISCLFLGDWSFLNLGGIVLLPIEAQLQARVTCLDIISLLDYFCKLFTTIVFTCKKSNTHLLNSWEWVLNRNLNHSVRGSNPLLTGSEDTVTRPLRQWRKNFLFQHKPSEEKS